MAAQAGPVEISLEDDKASALPAEVVATAVIDRPGDASTHFAFTHKIFTIQGCRFALNGSDKMPCFYIPMGEQTAAIELAKLQQEFNIDAKSIDAALLLKAQKGLNYVREIRPGDSIPREILDGSASWSVEQHHKDMALARIQMELIFWISGFREDFPSLIQMTRMQNEPEGRGQLKDAHKKIAAQLGLNDPKVSRKRVDEIARETTYIEALRERSQKLGEVLQKIGAFYTAFKKDTTFAAEVTRMQDLSRRGAKLIAERFGRVDNALKEILKAVSEPQVTIDLVRLMRDEVHLELKKWDEFFPKWAELKVERNEDSEKLFRQFYRFLAENYMETQSWGGGGKKK